MEIVRVPFSRFKSIAAAARSQEFEISRSSGILCVAVTCVMALIVLAHFGLVDAGQWWADEYYTFNELQARGWEFFWKRLVGWSPRPISELFIYGYEWVVHRTGKPLIGEFLAIPWCILIAAALAPAFATDRKLILPRLLLGLTLLVSFLVGHPTADMFYWPFGAAAYMPSLAGMTYVTLALLDHRLGTSSGRIVAAAALLLAAGTSEAGAMTVAIFFPTLLLLDRLNSAKLFQGAAWMIVPFGFSVGVIILELQGRAHGSLALIPDSPTLRHFWPSLRAAVDETLAEFITLTPGDTSSSAMLSGAVAKCLLFVGFRWCIRNGRFALLSDAPLAALAISLTITCFISLFAEYYLFGWRCCWRHDSLRMCFQVLTLLILAALTARRAKPGSAHLWVAPTVLLVSVLIPMRERIGELITSYRIYPSTVAARYATWADAARSGSEFEFREHPTPLTGTYLSPPGYFTRNGNAGWQIKEVARFFGKDAARVTRP